MKSEKLAEEESFSEKIIILQENATQLNFTQIKSNQVPAGDTRSSVICHLYLFFRLIQQ